MKIPAFAVITTRNRHELLAQAIASLEHDVHVVIVDNASDPPVSIGPSMHGRSVLRYEEWPPNLSHAWNLGLNRVSDIAQRADLAEWDVAVLNDDIVLPPRWLSTLSDAMRAERRVGLAHVDLTRTVGEPLVNRIPGPVPLETRITGYAFLLRGEAEMRFDETLRWWYGDDDMDWRCRAAGGVMRVPYQPVVHFHPSESTNKHAELGAQAGIDRETFAAKWDGRTPW